MTIPVLLVTGAIGSGKTTYISRLLSQRPRHERWAVLVNDFGEKKLQAGPDVGLREVAGCICCSAQVSLRAALVALLRERPLRLLIEASAAAHPRAIVAVLEEAGIAPAVVLERTVCVVDPAQALDARYASLEIYREQVKSADVALLTRSDERGDGARDALRVMQAQRIELLSW